MVGQSLINNALHLSIIGINSNLMKTEYIFTRSFQVKISFRVDWVRWCAKIGDTKSGCLLCRQVFNWRQSWYWHSCSNSQKQFTWQSQTILHNFSGVCFAIVIYAFAFLTYALTGIEKRYSGKPIPIFLYGSYTLFHKRNNVPLT